METDFRGGAARETNEGALEERDSRPIKSKEAPLPGPEKEPAKSASDGLAAPPIRRSRPAEGVTIA